MIGMLLILTVFAVFMAASFGLGWWMRGQVEQDQATEAVKAEMRAQHRQMAEGIIDRLYEGTDLGWTSASGESPLDLEDYPGTGTPVDYDESWGTE
jgi:hypothetical protein